MSKYEELMKKHSHIPISDNYKLKGNFKGIFANGAILIDKDLSNFQKHTVLAEEIAHYKYTYGNILDQSNMLNKKLELFARRKAYESVISLQGLIDAYNNGISNIHEMADFFEVNLSFIQECLKHYQMKYGLSVKYGEYIIEFEPLNIFKN
ncbi:toxin [Staphylococcus pseudintermedius]|uniref:ImmA/IrrE family metallo-endopeptidase n=1 Tax=Staphylococcus pseudintermedius TaxID=283734 RepID=UPI001036D7D4|nr:ImmA/IrrE family metallo-endopeptidase [Staphylococcus pseudintermedius]EGQ0298642.1 ImmA/IrrE family metallo-endopeptidase [Staphylococcus pseudintermedius]EGQ1709779.1 ImmA/IrrE family metallo-endopeptidase [Staphylococcus pseudintermedius]EGQ1786714.1 toxin [Staphylococcus pseudintermedius]EGQ2788189.1 ImmA/IrrE family metallo-endopeptidase [Staphylococcus pseudintermedius]EGQ3122419.1 ImmA/IrrE family metallo-endopeptidase [Staphylococcus pseudintermedius]